MQRKTWMALAFVFTMAALTAMPAKAASGNYWNPDQPDESMCQDMTGNWIMCDSQGGDGISGGGTAPGMQSCTSHKGCMSCGVPVGSPTGADECVVLRMKDGYCKCSIGQTGCSLSGACTYSY